MAAIDCAICFKRCEHIATLSCGHRFCAECVMMWAAKDDRCPTCRRHMLCAVAPSISSLAGGFAVREIKCSKGNLGLRVCDYFPGVQIIGVSANGDASAGGCMLGDIVISVNGNATTSHEMCMREMLRLYSRKEIVQLCVKPEQVLRIPSKPVVTRRAIVHQANRWSIVTLLRRQRHRARVA